MSAPRVVVVGAGMGGLAAAADLASRGYAVTVVERAPASGGKMREVLADGAAIDAGPTVFTMRWIFEDLFRDAGAEFADRVALTPAVVLARHAWRDGGRLDLYADAERSARAIEAFAGRADADGYRDFCARSRAVYRTLEQPFIASSRPSPYQLVRRVGLKRLDAMWQTSPLQTLWGALGSHFRDPRLRQLFGRYATYVGSSPFQAPATLMLVAHVEQQGVWTVEGGMRRIADAVVDLAKSHGASFRFATGATEIRVERGRVRGVLIAGGEELPAEAVVFNGEVAALATGLLGRGAASAVKPPAPADRSLSAVTWCARAGTSGFDLSHHNVFFGEDYADEFRAIFRARSITSLPTVYICAQDRAAGDNPVHGARESERLLILINAPPYGDIAPMSEAQRAEYGARMRRVLGDCGLALSFEQDACVMTTPADFDGLFPASGGALYGRVNHGAFASFARPGAATAIRGLYLAGGSTHPGAGIPMATMSGRLAAASIASDLPARR